MRQRAQQSVVMIENAHDQVRRIRRVAIARDQFHITRRRLAIATAQEQLSQAHGLRSCAHVARAGSDHGAIGAGRCDDAGDAIVARGQPDDATSRWRRRRADRHRVQRGVASGHRVAAEHADHGAAGIGCGIEHGIRREAVARREAGCGDEPVTSVRPRPSRRVREHREAGRECDARGRTQSQADRGVERIASGVARQFHEQPSARTILAMRADLAHDEAMRRIARQAVSGRMRTTEQVGGRGVRLRHHARTPVRLEARSRGWRRVGVRAPCERRHDAVAQGTRHDQLDSAAQRVECRRQYGIGREHVPRAGRRARREPPGAWREHYSASARERQRERERVVVRISAQRPRAAQCDVAIARRQFHELAVESAVRAAERDLLHERRGRAAAERALGHAQRVATRRGGRRRDDGDQPAQGGMLDRESVGRSHDTRAAVRQRVEHPERAMERARELDVARDRVQCERQHTVGYGTGRGRERVTREQPAATGRARLTGARAEHVGQFGDQRAVAVVGAQPDAGVIRGPHPAGLQFQEATARVTVLARQHELAYGEARIAQATAARERVAVVTPDDRRRVPAPTAPGEHGRAAGRRRIDVAARAVAHLLQRHAHGALESEQHDATRERIEWHEQRGIRGERRGVLEVGVDLITGVRADEPALAREPGGARTGSEHPPAFEQQRAGAVVGLQPERGLHLLEVAALELHPHGGALAVGAAEIELDDLERPRGAGRQ